MKKITLFMVMMLIMATSSWCEEYKSMCELYPDECAESNLAKLGQTVVTKSGNHIFRVIAEAEGSGKSTWYQFINTCRAGEKLDGKCDFGIFFILKKDGLYVRKYSCEQVTLMLKSYCKIKGIKYDDFVHKPSEREHTSKPFSF